MELSKIGYGVYKITDKKIMEEALNCAINTGYRLIDTASYYKNEEAIGNVIKYHKLKDEINIITKIWLDDMGFDNTLRAFEKSYEKLGKIDILLVHWPHPDKFIQTYKALEKLYNEKAVKKIGVSNFTIDNLEKLKAECSIKPFLNEIELHPKLSQKELREYLNKEGIKTLAWSPIARARYADDKILVEIAKKHNVTTTQVILAWHVQNNVIPLPKSEKDYRIRENFEAQFIKLSKEDMERIDNMDENLRYGMHPDEFPYS